MKKIIAILFSFFILTSFTNINFTTEEQLAQKIVSAIKNNDKSELLKLIITEEESISLFDSCIAPDSVKNEFKFAIRQDSGKTIRNIERKFSDITKKLSDNNCLSSITISKVIPETTRLQTTIELGKLDIEIITCGSKQETITVKIIKTKEGWKILEKLKLIYKE